MAPHPQTLDLKRILRHQLLIQIAFFCAYWLLFSGIWFAKMENFVGHDNIYIAVLFACFFVALYVLLHLMLLASFERHIQRSIAQPGMLIKTTERGQHQQQQIIELQEQSQNQRPQQQKKIIKLHKQSKNQAPQQQQQKIIKLQEQSQNQEPQQQQKIIKLQEQSQNQEPQQQQEIVELHEQSQIQVPQQQQQIIELQEQSQNQGPPQQQEQQQPQPQTDTPKVHCYLARYDSDSSNYGDDRQLMCVQIQVAQAKDYLYEVHE